MTRRCVAVVLILLCHPVAGATGESLEYEPIGRIAISRPTGTPRAVAVLLTGDDGFTVTEAAIASTLAAAGALVLGVDLRQYRASLARSWASEVYPSADLELLSQFAQRASGLQSYQPPVIVGIGAGAALVYASLAQANPNAFRGAVSVSFCPLLALPRPPGRGRGLATSPGDDGTFRLAPSPVVQGRWVVVQPENDHTCPLALVREFVQRVARAKLIVAPDGPSALASRVRAAFLGIAVGSGEDERAARATDVGDLPLVELRATGAPTRTLAVMLSGDGGWASIDRDIGGQLAARGVDVVGLNSLRYFWTRRTPESAAADLDRILRHYLAAWGGQRVLLLGYSRGADVLPFLAARLAPDLRSRVSLVVLLGPSRSVDFEFHLSDWVANADRGTELPIRPEVEKLRGLNVLCVYGKDETDSLCPELGPAQAIVLEQPGGHHFGGDYDDIVTHILAAASS
jgi:type IV secretory pathway VirJ component